MSCCVMKYPAGSPRAGKYTVYNKGAAEWVLQRCNTQYSANGRIIPLDDAQRQVRACWVRCACCAVLHRDVGGCAWGPHKRIPFAWPVTGRCAHTRAAAAAWLGC